jgi:5-methyltetrahydropteroyltriglutamate--homocysteine methyltransferase
MVGRLRDSSKVHIVTTQVGQYPKPAWYRYNIGDREFSTLAEDHEFLESYSDAAKAIILDQEVAGLDILTDGGLRYDRTGPKNERIAGWGTNNLCYMAGAKHDKPEHGRKTIIESIITNEVVKAAYEVCGGAYPDPQDLRWVIEDGPEVGNLYNWVETFKIAQPFTRKPLRFVAPSAAMAAVWAANKTSRSDRDVFFELFRLQNKILRAIADEGCKIIQLDYPFGLTHWAANKTKVKNEIWKDLIQAANEEIKGVNAHVWYHFCFGAPSLWGPVAPPMKFSVVETYKQIADSKADLLQSEAANTRGEYLEDELKTWKEYCPEKEVGVGAVTPYSSLETIEDVERIVEKALKYVPPESLVITSDEGLAGHGSMVRAAAFDKMKLTVLAVEKARQQIGIQMYA